jgi:hypothetical protein
LLILLGLSLLQARREKGVPWAALLPGLALVLGYAVLASLAVGHPVISPKQGQLDTDADVFPRLWTSIRILHAVFPVLLVPGALAVGVRRQCNLLLPVLYLLLLPLYDIHIQERLYLPALPFFLLLGLEWNKDLTATRRRLVLATSAVLLGMGARHLSGCGIFTPRAKEIGTTLRPYVGFHDRVAGRFPFVAYYAGAGFVRLPLAPYSALLDSLITMQATHLLVLESELQNITPHLKPLFEDRAFVAAESRLEALAWVHEPAGDRAILYGLRQPPVTAAAAPAQGHGVSGLTWLGEKLVIATGTGLEMWESDAQSKKWNASRVLLPGHDIRDPSASPEGTRLVFVVGPPETSSVTVFDLESNELVLYPVTRDDRPSSPVFVGDHLLYVRGTPPGGMRSLDTQSSAVRDVVLQGLEPSNATPLAVTARGTEVAITYVRTQPNHDLQRVIATATWPGSDTRFPTSRPLELPGRWAVQLALAHDALAWVPGADRLLASVALSEPETYAGVHVRSSLCVVQSDGLFRRLTFALEVPRQPALRTTRLAFVSARGDLRVATLETRVLAIPPVRVFQPVTPRKP